VVVVVVGATVFDSPRGGTSPCREPVCEPNELDKNIKKEQINKDRRNCWNSCKNKAA